MNGRNKNRQVWMGFAGLVAASLLVGCHGGGAVHLATAAERLTAAPEALEREIKEISRVEGVQVTYHESDDNAMLDVTTTNNTRESKDNLRNKVREVVELYGTINRPSCTSPLDPCCRSSMKILVQDTPDGARILVAPSKAPIRDLASKLGAFEGTP